MESQLTLIDPDETNWGLDEHIKAVGRQGIARAREALRLAGASASRDPATPVGTDPGRRQAA
ncbi:MAG: hypothetical protein ACRDY2_13715 [Acidimicrobiales bacterium]